MQNTEHKNRAKALLQTPNLLSAFEYPLFSLHENDVNWEKWSFEADTKKLRFGHYMEALYAACLNASARYTLLAKNVQLVENKVTKGELDFFVFDTFEKRHLHIELACKFYLHIAQGDLFIGPNKRDRLDLKLEKLRSQQLPNLHLETAKPFFASYGIEATNVKQYLALPGMIFSNPKNSVIPEFINPLSISGSWIPLKSFKTDAFNTFQYYLPEKVNWMMPLHDNCQWIDFDEAFNTLMIHLEKGENPMLWVKLKQGDFQRAFVLP